MTQSDNVPHIPGYKQLRYFDEGGMGRIYRALNEKTDAEVIIKCMNIPDSMDDYSYYHSRFVRETDIAKFLEGGHQHPNVLAAVGHGDLVETGSQYTIPYLIYPYKENGSLSKLLKQEEPWHTWPLPHIADLIVQAAEGLFHLHKIHLVHQDVKPNNFLWSFVDMTESSFNRVHIWLIDYGIAEWEGKTTFIAGTAGYRAPEQLLGDVKYSSDQYALAVMARLFLTGHLPPQENIQPSPLDIPLTDLNPSLRHIQGIDDIVQKALSRRPEDRFVSILEFARTLQEAVLQSENRTNRNMLLSSAESLAEEAGFYQKSTAQSPEKHPLQPRQGVQPLFPSAKEKPLIRPLIQPIVPYVPIENILENIPPLPVRPPKAMTSNLSFSLPTFPLQKLFSVSLPAEPTLLAWSPDGYRLLCTFIDDAPRIVHTDQHLELLSDFAFGHSACWSPDGRFLAISIYNTDQPQAEVHIWNPHTPKESSQSLRFPYGTPIYGLDWSSSGFLALWLENNVFIYDLSQFSAQASLPSPYRVLTLDTMRCDKRTALRWSPDGMLLAAGANNGTIVCWNLSTMISQRQDFDKGVESISWSPDSTIVAVALVNKMIGFWNPRMDTNRKITLPERPRMVDISAQTARLAIATDNMLFFGNIRNTPLPDALHPGGRLVAWSATNKIATLDQQEKDRLIIWQA